MSNFIPWGELPWLMSRLSGRQWAFIGCVSHEDRFLSALTVLKTASVRATFVRIFDEDPLDELEERRSLDAQLARAVTAGLGRQQILDAPLLATIDAIERITVDALDGCASVIVDISCFPKRWFFVIARLLKENTGL